jgi:hypothetical protein
MYVPKVTVIFIFYRDNKFVSVMEVIYTTEPTDLYLLPHPSGHHGDILHVQTRPDIYH